MDCFYGDNGRKQRNCQEWRAVSAKGMRNSRLELEGWLRLVLRDPLFPGPLRLGIGLLGSELLAPSSEPLDAPERVHPLVAVLDALPGAKLSAPRALDEFLLLAPREPALVARSAVARQPKKHLLKAALPVPRKPASQRAPAHAHASGGTTHALPPPHKPQSPEPLACLQVPFGSAAFVQLIGALLPVDGLDRRSSSPPPSHARFAF